MNEQWDAEALATAVKIIPVLHGMPLNQARYALRLAKTLLLETNKVDAHSAEFKAVEKECHHAPSK